MWTIPEKGAGVPVAELIKQSGQSHGFNTEGLTKEYICTAFQLGLEESIS